MGTSLTAYPQIPCPPSEYMGTTVNRLLREELDYDKDILKIEFEDLYNKLNNEQKYVYTFVIEAVELDKGGLFFVYGSRGCCKTFLWKTLILKIRSEGKTILLVASSRIATTLLPGGRTGHFRFGILIILHEYSTCIISQCTMNAELLQKMSLIIWDEAPMQHRHAFEALDRALNDIMKTVNPEANHRPFGGLTVVLGGDFHQILHVIAKGRQEDIVNACITRSPLLPRCHIFTLNRNMRIYDMGNSDNKLILNFTRWVLNLGDGKIPHVYNDNDVDDYDYEIMIPSYLVVPNVGNGVTNLINMIYQDIASNYTNHDYLRQRSILTPINDIVDAVNTAILDLIPREIMTYNSVDSIEDASGDQEEMESSFPVEFLNLLNMLGLPHQELKLKKGVDVMLLRNINKSIGLCNGTRMIVTQLAKWRIEAEVLSRTFSGRKHFIPRMFMNPSCSNK